MDANVKFSSRAHGYPVRRTVAGMATARWNDTIIASSDDTVVVEGNHYFPLESVSATLVETSTTSVCPWKGTASYYSVEVDGKTNADAAWFYPTPKDAAAEIKGKVAFWKGVVVTD
ncbi:MAG: hypothetical protein JWN22_1334 [Nocardioides sp.]|nr:hypothetical protein [Nocardioides sp.]